MKLLTLTQGSPEWHAHRATSLNASDAPAMLGISPYKSRSELLREKATGIVPEIDAATQSRFDDGHRAEALARPLAEQVIGEELYPCVGTSDDGRYSASFDGLDMLETVAFEHKLLSANLREAMFEGCTSDDLPEHYRAQMEQQLLVSGADRVLFMSSAWDGQTLVDERHCWYTSDLELRARIIAGWEQFEADVAEYQPEPIVSPAPVGRAPEQLPSLHIEVTGMVTASNLAEFKAQAMTVLGVINRDLKTDNDFADAEKTVKWCELVEQRLAAAKDHALSQTADIDALFRTLDEVSAEARSIRLELNRSVKTQKDQRRAEIVAASAAAVREHYDHINATLGEHALSVPAGLLIKIGEAIKGKRTIASLCEAAGAAVAAAKIEASRQSERVRTNMALLDKYAEHSHLFADRVTLCATKDLEDLRNLVTARITAHQTIERERLEQERENIRAEEAAKLERQHAAAEQEQVQPVATAPHVPAPSFIATTSAPAPTGQRIKLGDINALISPLSITAEGLTSLGFAPVSTERGAKLYDSNDLPAIYRALASVIQMAASK